MTQSLTQGPHHIGLSVTRLEASAAFFTDLLGWKEVRRRPDYPAIFVSDGHILVTLWAVKSSPALGFDRHANVGLHHVAFRVASREALQQLHDRLVASEVPIEFAPQLVGDGPAMHMMCYEPSGIRVEFFWPGEPP